MLSKILKLIKTHESDLILVVSVVMLTIISFNLGKISVSNNSTRSATVVEGDSDSMTAGIYKPASTTSIKKPVVRTDLSVVASMKSKSKYYHFSWCSGAKQISDANKLTFANEQEAIAAGYHLATNCTK